MKVRPNPLGGEFGRDQMGRAYVSMTEAIIPRVP
jgi:hypothetical protein